MKGKYSVKWISVNGGSGVSDVRSGENDGSGRTDAKLLSDQRN